MSFPTSCSHGRAVIVVSQSLKAEPTFEDAGSVVDLGAGITGVEFETCELEHSKLLAVTCLEAQIDEQECARPAVNAASLEADSVEQECATHAGEGRSTQLYLLFPIATRGPSEVGPV